MNVKFLRIITIALLYLNGLTAVGGGMVLIIDPKGSILKLSVELLNGSPFKNYLIPGIILLVFNGFFSLVTLYFTIKKKNLYQHLIILQGIILFIWLSTQILLIKYFFAPLHITYFLISLLLIIAGSIILKNNITK